MKKRIIPLSLVLAAALFVGTALAAGGDANDPLISLDYLNSIFTPAAQQQIEQRLDASDARVYDAAAQKWKDAVNAVSESGNPAAFDRVTVWTETRLKQGDALAGLTGTQVQLLAGAGSVYFNAGTVVDVTDGTELASGAELRLRHRYMVAEDTAAAFTVSSRTAVLDYCGDYQILPSADRPDYNAMAAALKSLSLLRGTDTGFGEGFDLEKAPARVEALVMLIRLLGEEKAALACTAEQPFSDVPPWADRYVAYAAEQGYTNGIGGGLFGTTRQTVAVEYVEFVLRALGYSSTEQTDISDALERAQTAGVVNGNETTLLQTAEFLRADIAYLSYYALSVPLSGTDTQLYQKLENRGVFTEDAYRGALALVTSGRL